MGSDIASNKSVTARLSAMMFIQFFIWGSWYTMVGIWMTEIGIADAIGWVYTVGPLAAIVAPLFLGMIADRFFSSERVLSVLLFIGGAAMLFAPGVGQSCAEAWQATQAQLVADGTTVEAAFGKGVLGIFPPIIPDHLPFIGLIFLHMLCFMPTLGLTNTIAFRNISVPEKQFPMIRVFGTIGWIVAGVVLSTVLKWDATSNTLTTTGIACFVFGVYAFFLPHTPPTSKGEKASISELLGLNAAGSLMKSPSFAVFMIASLLICIPLAGYYAYGSVFVGAVGYESPGGVMTWGQVSEIFFMVLVPFFFVRLGVKWMLGVGMLMWVLRYVLFALAAPDNVLWMVFLGILMHGICYDFFFVTGQIYTERKAGEKIRAQAQGFLVLMTQGIGLGLGAPIIQRIVNNNSADGVIDWQPVWITLAIMAAVVLVLFVVVFRDKIQNREAAVGAE